MKTFAENMIYETIYLCVAFFNVHFYAMQYAKRNIKRNQKNNKILQ